MNALILAAGLGTRLKPFTDLHPKALAPINGKPVLQRNVEYLQRFGITDVIVNVHHFAEQVIAAIETNNGWGSNITISDERNAILETGGGIKKATWFLEKTEHCVVMNADILTDMPLNEMIDSHVRTMSIATLATSTRTSSRYLLFNSSGQLCGWRNDKTGERKIPFDHGTFIDKAFSGIQVLKRDIFGLIRNTGKFSMIDAYLDICGSHRIDSFDHSAYQMIDIGTPEKLEQASQLFA
ncbi:MAG: sugar phosphate nucleotidyltransferase [Chitinophagaceae bacterium]